MEPRDGTAPPAPRLAAAWAPKVPGGLKLSAGWGTYYDTPTLALLALSEEQTSLMTYYAPNGLPQGAPTQTFYLLNTRDLRTPRYTVSSVSAEMRLLWNLVGRLDLTDREGSRGFALDQIATSSESKVANSINMPLSAVAMNEYVVDNSRYTKYRAAEITLRRTFLSKYQWLASYTRSEARSNAVVQYTIENPVLTPQSGGPLPWDAPSRILMWGWAPLEKKWFPPLFRPIVEDTDLQLLGEYHTGFPFSAVTEAGYLAGPPDSLRYPPYLLLNVALERQFRFHGYLWALRLGVINALDRANPNVVNTDANSPQFLLFARGQPRAFNLRLRLLGKK